LRVGGGSGTALGIARPMGGHKTLPYPSSKPLPRVINTSRSFPSALSNNPFRDSAFTNIPVMPV
jgi:hypothetical protein